MKSICLYFQVHQPLRLRRYRFFDIGNNHYYYDDFGNESLLRKMANDSYLPSNKIILKLIHSSNKQFKVSFSISGVLLDLLELYTPDVIDSFKELADTGCVDFVAETYSHSLVALKNKQEFKAQVKMHSKRIEQLFGQKPVAFSNTEMIYSDDIGKTVASMGFKAMLTEGAKHILGWKSPNYLYCNALNPKLKLLMRNYNLSDDIAFRFSVKEWNEWPLTSEKFTTWLDQLDDKEELVNIFMAYETFGEHQKKESGIFKFLKKLPLQILNNGGYKFATPGELVKEYQPIAVAHVPNTISWTDEERDLSAWLGNELQDEAFNKLYELSDAINELDDARLRKDWNYLQSSDHFYYMCTKFFSDGDVRSYFNPYNSPYDAFINYMNVLSDFKLRIEALKKEKSKSVPLETVIAKKDKEIKHYKSELTKLKQQFMLD